MSDRVEIPLVIRYEKAKEKLRELELDNQKIITAMNLIAEGLVENPIDFAKQILNSDN